MTFRTGVVLALVLVSVLAVPVLSVAADADDPASDSYYKSQLDANGTAVYDAVTSKFLETTYPVSVGISAQFQEPVLCESEAEAQTYAEDVVDSSLAAKYYSGPENIWLWDLPVTDVQVTAQIAQVKVDGYQQSFYVVKSVSFTLTVPEEYRDPDNETPENDVEVAMREVRDAAADLKYEGDAAQKVREINSRLLRVNVVDDEDGKVSNIHDALVGGSSSSAGIAAAFTYLCSVNNVQGVTVKGTVYTQFAGDSSAETTESHTGYWNAVYTQSGDGSAWFATDVTCNSGSDECLMAGGNTSVTIGQGLERFSATHVPDLDLVSPNSLVAPTLSSGSYPYDDPDAALMTYGPYVLMAIVAAVIIYVIYMAAKRGDL